MATILPVADNGAVYVPHFNALDDLPGIQALVSAVGSAQLVTTGPDRYPLASLLPVIWDPEGDRLVMHMAKANQHWKAIEPDAPALVVVTGPEAYVSPAWYATKAEHGKVVPTWNYSAVHFTGRVTVEHDPEWLHGAVSWLTDLHEARRANAGHDSWSVDDPPDKYVAGQLRAIVGIQVHIEKVEGKAKLSQNRSEADRAGVVAGLRSEVGPAGVRGEAQVADRMAGDLGL
jgi:transcriptional regulator